MKLGRPIAQPPSMSRWDDQAPIRSELFSIERLEEHARSLAAAQPVSIRRRRGHALAHRLAANAAFLLQANLQIAASAEATGQITPAAEWLIDNYHLVDMQIREIGVDLPPGYYAQLPKLADGPFAGLPRVFGATWSLVAHTDSLFDPETLRRYLVAYQAVQKLTIGELWAVPITLRIVLIENLRRVAEVIAANSATRHAADTLADRLTSDAAAAIEPSADVLAAVPARALSDPFAVQLAHRLRGQDPKTDPALAWLDQRLAAQGTTIDVVVHAQLQEQGAFNATIRNIINSLRLIAGIDWTDVFEKASTVDAVLAEAGGFTEMDFPTRNLYRNAVEVLARGARRTEYEVAGTAVAAARQAATAGAPQRRRDAGYHLLAGGRPALEAAIGFQPSFRARLGAVCRGSGIAGYGTSVVALTCLFIAVPLWLGGRAGIGSWWLAALAVLGFIFASDTSVACLNRWAMWGFGATALPGLQLANGIPASLRTLVAVPTLLTSPEAIEELVARLEVHFLASKDGEVHFALLSDWTDSATENAPQDAALLSIAAAGIARLNQLYSPAPGGARFLLLHRRRVWNASERSWIGWERKRGKLHELNRLLRGAKDTNFLENPGQGDLPDAIRYVVTLDSDTRLPHGTVRRLVGKLAHPLNAAHFDVVSGRVTEGYALLQPRVTPSLPVGRHSSLFQRIFSSMDGIDPYAAAVSDVYQDMLGEGSYAGKGIYDIDAFEQALSGRVPESTLLSHDLFEGVFARAGLASDIEVVEEFPAVYAMAALRQHRWARGDWQLLPWILSLRALPAIGRWKMLDNLRRTLSAPAAIATLLVGWQLKFGTALVWTVFVLLAIGLPALLPVAGDIVPRRQWITWKSYFGVIGAGLCHAGTLTCLVVVFLAHQACLMLDAILRTLLRLVTRRHLLQWVTAAQTGDGPDLDMAGTYRRMGGAPVIGLLTVLLVVFAHPLVWLLAAPFALCWVASPAVALWASAYSLSNRRLAATPADIRMLRVTARRTWRFFESFVTSADNMLPPDNFQEDPRPVLAHRTSPTNIGLYLLSVVAAHDFGWIGRADAADRLEATLATMARLARFRGHFYNWYDTTDLRPLEPAYVSTVDSGNLAGHLIALASACRLWREHAHGPGMWRDGIADALDLAAETAGPDDETELGMRNFAVARKAFAAAAGATSCAEPDLAILRILAQASVTRAGQCAATFGPDRSADLLYWSEAAVHCIDGRSRDLDPATAVTLPDRLLAIETAARALAMEMEFGFLRNDSRKLLSIGFLVAEDVLDENCYDLLASEARLAVFVAIAKGDVPAREWFRLGRAVTPVGTGAALVSWSGSMFEYLMPSLVMRAPSGSLLEQTSRLIVQRQIAFGAGRAIPWGVSESAYNVRDLEFTYQYSNFGVPGLGLKRGLGQEAVIAPYATALAAMVDPQEAVRNLGQLEAAGGRGRHGFYEALDYTQSRIPHDQPVAVVRAFMAHHQGMSILAIADTVLDGIMRTRFHADPIIQATELLLQERAPRNGAVARALPSEDGRQAQARALVPPGGRRFTTADTAMPATHLLSNGRYSVMLTASGAGYSRWMDFAVTRWREDSTLDDWGSYIYLKDVGSGRIWSAGHQPIAAPADGYCVNFSEDRATYERRDGTLTTTQEILISAEEDAEVRRITLTNAGPDAREIELTSYAELALIPQAADIAHPAFAKLFVQTEHLPELGAILATRRRRTPTEAEIWAGHCVVVSSAVTAETDRARFLGRGHGVRDPAAITGRAPLSDTTGTVLDAVFSLRCRVTVPAGGMVRVAFWTMVASTRVALVDAIDKHRDTASYERASTLAWTLAQVQLRHLGISPGEADLFQRLAAHLLFAGPALRPPSSVIVQGAGPQSGLWPQGISGDLPILLLRIADGSDLDIARQILLAHEYFQLKQLPVDLVILNDHPPSYAQDLQIALETLVRTLSRNIAGQGRVFLLRADLIPAATAALLSSVARVTLSAVRGGLSEQLDRADKALIPPPAAVPTKPTAFRLPRDIQPVPALEFFNGSGGFAEDGREYVIVLGPGQTTPAPWINVIANPGFGFHASAEGTGYSWAGNSRENQLTPWSNDPVTDRPGEAFFLQDADTAELWCPTASLRRDPAATYIARHGHGYSRFDRVAHGIASSLLQYVPLADPIKISRLQLHNLSGRKRSISLTAYVEWVLGPSRGAAAAFVATEIDPQTGAMFARNPWNAATAGHVAFADLTGQTDWTGDRRSFTGRNGTLANPAGLGGIAPFSKATGAGLDPCGALRTTVTLPPDGSVDLIFLLGQGDTPEAARRLVTQYRTANLDEVLQDVKRQWKSVLGAVQVKTPDRSMDIMLNGWLLYQTLSCRVWARSGFYQASGAFGFRDQLQDGMALTASSPAIVRAHLLDAASRQFTEGDVLHWWLPTTGTGVRTRISDDRAWLATTVAQYVQATGDSAVLDEQVGFLTAALLAPEEHDRFFLPATAPDTASLYDHCALALDHSLAVGAHDLPLIGTGDWNDGMNRIGEAGRGESVWLGWFLHAALTEFAKIADQRGDITHATGWRAHAAALLRALEDAWDGDWYLRAWFDDGTALGSHENAECQIDAIAQSWAVISGAARPERAAHAMRSVMQRLVRPEEGLVLVLAPPFDSVGPDPGYIRGYPPGIRENGGQYTHAALWTVMATAALGDGEAAATLFGRLNPINHTRTAADVARYKVEPYVVVADIYSVAPHIGRGGWSWYTGSAGWMQRIGIESILGVQIRAGALHVNPCIPGAWPHYTVTIAWHTASYTVDVHNPAGVSHGVVMIRLDGADLAPDQPLLLQDDGASHAVIVTLG